MPFAHSTSNKLARIVLLGFMGAGKSTVGTLLAQRLGWDFHDADAVLEKRTGLTIAELFTHHGEAGFRVLEAEAVATLMQQQHAVIALGGGAIESSSTRSLFDESADTLTVFLDAPLQTMLDRCQLSPGIRPLLQDRDALPARYARRLPYYQSAAITVDTESLTPEAVVQVLIQQLNDPAIEAREKEASKGQSL